MPSLAKIEQRTAKRGNKVSASTVWRLLTGRTLSHEAAVSLAYALAYLDRRPVTGKPSDDWDSFDHHLLLLLSAAEEMEKQSKVVPSFSLLSLLDEEPEEAPQNMPLWLTQETFADDPDTEYLTLEGPSEPASEQPSSPSEEIARNLNGPMRESLIPRVGERSGHKDEEPKPAIEKPALPEFGVVSQPRRRLHRLRAEDVADTTEPHKASAGGLTADPVDGGLSAERLREFTQSGLTAVSDLNEGPPIWLYGRSAKDIGMPVGVWQEWLWAIRVRAGKPEASRISTLAANLFLWPESKGYDENAVEAVFAGDDLDYDRCVLTVRTLACLTYCSNKVIGEEAEPYFRSLEPEMNRLWADAAYVVQKLKSQAAASSEGEQGPGRAIPD